MAKGVKVWMKLDGKFFHRVDAEGYCVEQGQILIERSDGTVIAQFYEEATDFDGASLLLKSFGVRLLTTFHFEGAWFYETKNEMHTAHVHHRKVRPHKVAVPVATGGA